MRTLKDLLPQKRVAQKVSIDDKTVFYLCKRVLVEEYGIRGGENIIPVLYKDGKLFLSPRSSLWASEITLQKTHLCKRINALLGSDEVCEVKLARQQ